VSVIAEWMRGAVPTLAPWRRSASFIVAPSWMQEQLGSESSSAGIVAVERRGRPHPASLHTQAGVTRSRTSR
jgi:hypothetical protein